MIYLDNNATTPVAPEVIETMLPCLRDTWGNPSSLHEAGTQAARGMRQARAKLASLLGASPAEIVFTGSGTESSNMAIHGMWEATGRKLPVITSTVEHPAVLYPCRALRKAGARVTELPVDRAGNLDMDALDQALQEGPSLVSLMFANNETGVVFPIRDIARKVKAANGFIHTDAVQAAGRVPLDLSELPVDMLSISGHKFHAPKGVGVLFIRRRTPFSPLMLGGTQEHGLRPGTENLAYAVGIARAYELGCETMNDLHTRIQALRDQLEEAVGTGSIPCTINGRESPRVPNTSNISFRHVEGERLVYALDACNIAVSTGSACSSGASEPSHVLRAMGLPHDLAAGTLRFSLSRYTTQADIDALLAALREILATPS